MESTFSFSEPLRFSSKFLFLFGSIDIFFGPHVGPVISFVTEFKSSFKSLKYFFQLSGSSGSFSINLMYISSMNWLLDLLRKDCCLNSKFFGELI